MNEVWRVIKRDVRGGITALYTKYLWKSSQMKNKSITSMFAKTVAKLPNKIAIKFRDESWTFEQLDKFSNKVANCFNAQGLKAGDEIGIIMNNCPEFVGIWLGLAKIGVVSALINTNNRLLGLIDCFHAFKCKAIIYGIEFKEAIDEIHDQLMIIDSKIEFYVWSSNIDESSHSKIITQQLPLLLNPMDDNTVAVDHKRNFTDILFYVFTSGTTGGKAKATIQTDGRVISIVASGHYIYGIKNNDIIYAPFPLYHSMSGIGAVGQCLMYGITITIAERFSATHFWQDCIKYKCTIAQYIGETCRYLLAQPSVPEETQHSIRLFFGVGLRQEYWTQFKDRFRIKSIYESYGCSEGNVWMSNLDKTAGACGFLPYYYGPLVNLFYATNIIMVDPVTMEPVRNRKGLCKKIKPGQLGVVVGIHKKSEPMEEFVGYTDQKETDKKFINNVFSIGDSAFKSDDLLLMDRYGYVFFKDRTGDIFRWKGENVSTSDVEAVIQSCLSLNDCIVFGVAVGQCEGKAGMAAISGKASDIDFTVLAEQLVKRLPSYAIPLFLRIVDSFESTSTHKPIKYKLRNDGFDPNITEDEIYFFDKSIKNYVLLTNDIFTELENGSIKV